MTKHSISNALTIDVEDYFQVAALAEAVDRDEWHAMEYRVEANVNRLLEFYLSELDLILIFYRCHQIELTNLFQDLF